jgi:hypothetical protein
MLIFGISQKVRGNDDSSSSGLAKAMVSNDTTF